MTTTAGPPAAPRTASAPARRRALAGLALVVLLSSLGTSVAQVALPTVGEEFGASFGAVQWVVIAYLLTVTTLVVGAGRLGDLVGRRRLLLAGVAVFTAASVLAAAAPALPVLILARTLQGFGAAAMLALGLALVADVVPEGRTGRGMGLIGSTSAVGTALGPSLGGLLVAGLGWRAIFLVNVPLGLAALAMVHRHLPADRRAPAGGRSRLDLAGMQVLVLTVGAYALAATVDTGRLGRTGAALLVAAVAGAALLVLVERRAAAPLIGGAMLRDPVLRSGLVAGTLVSAVVMATLVVGPFYLSRALALDPARIGLTMSAGPAVVAFSGVPAGRLTDRLGPRRVTLAGLVVMVAGALLLAVPAPPGVAGYLAAVIVVTLGYALFQTANTTAVMARGGAGHRGATSGMLTLSRNLGLITGASVMGAVFAVASGTTATAAAGPDGVATGLRVTFAVGAGLVLAALAVVGGAGRSALTRPARVFRRPRPPAGGP